MKKYKLIKTYPTSFGLGVIAEYISKWDGYKVTSTIGNHLTILPCDNVEPHIGKNWEEIKDDSI